jgi:hypothetical protein
MFTRNDGAGFFEIDHRDSPGMTEADLAMMPDAMMVRGGRHLERDAKQCNHCQRLVILNPNRVQDRERCPKCDKYLCDWCYGMFVKTGDCTPFAEVILRAFELAVKYQNQPDHPDAAIDVEKLSQPGEARIFLTDAP